MSRRLLHAYHLPGLGAEATELLTVEVGADLALAFPKLDAAAVARVADHVLAARSSYLADLPLERIVTTVDRAVSRWLEPFSSYRGLAERWLPAITGYPESVIRKGLAGYLATFRAENLWRMLEEELRDPLMLDEFRPRGAVGGYSRAFGPKLTAHVFAGNVPGLPAQSLVAALLAKSASIGKASSEEPLFPYLFVQSLAEIDPRLADCLAVTWWPGGSDEVEAPLFRRADAVVAYGGERAIDSVRARVNPGARFIGYGHKLSFGVIGRECLTHAAIAETAARAAYDVVKYDQQGCLSPHLFYVERGGEVEPRELAAVLAKAMESYRTLVPRGRLTLEEGARLRDLVGRYELRADPAIELTRAEDGTSWAVIFDERPEVEASCLNRVVRVKPIPDVLAVPDLVAPVRRYVQTAGIAVGLERHFALATALGAAGLDRICPLGQMPDPSVAWHHDGRFNVLDLLRFTDLEAEQSVGRWELTHPALGIHGRV